MSAPFNLSIGLIVSTEAGARLAADADKSFLDALREGIGREPTPEEHEYALTDTLQKTVALIANEAIRRNATIEEVRQLAHAVVDAYTMGMRKGALH